MSKLFIIGAGGFGKEVANVAKLLGNWDEINFIDDSVRKSTYVNGIPVIGKFEILGKIEGDIFIGIGSLNARNILAKELKTYKSLNFPNIIHPSCNWINNNLNKIGKGNYIGEGTIATVNITIGDFNLINLGCLISHDSEIGSFCNLMHGVKITSGASLHNFISVGAGASIISKTHIQSGTEIAPNSVYK